MLRRAHRLSRKSDFQTVHREGRRIATDFFSILTVVNSLERSRFSVVVRKSFGSAVVRNKAKRRARSLFRCFQKSITPAMDILLFPKNAMKKEKQAVLEEHFRRALAQAQTRQEKK